MNVKEAKQWLLIAGTIILIVVLAIMAGCSQLNLERDLHTGCDLECKGCTEVKLKCNQNWDTEQATESQGTITGPTIQ